MDKILIVDDDEAILQMLGDYLGQEYGVVTAEDGYKGLAEVIVDCGAIPCAAIPRFSKRYEELPIRIPDP